MSRGLVTRRGDESVAFSRGLDMTHRPRPVKALANAPAAKLRTCSSSCKRDDFIRDQGD